MNLKSLYICVQDMNRAIEFYEELLGQTVTEKDDIYSVFDINGFRLGKAILEKKIMGKEICFPLTLIRGNWVVEIVDSEGNHIEMTAPAV